VSEEQLLEKAVTDPDPERAADTLNHINEGIWEPVGRVEAVEAAVWAESERSKLHQTIEQMTGELLLLSLKYVVRKRPSNPDEAPEPTEHGGES
jgi:hypothetical protein